MPVKMKDWKELQKISRSMHNAIQTQNINDGKTKLDGINSDGKVKPTDVWAVLERQNPTTTVSVKEEANSDIKQGN